MKTASTNTATPRVVRELKQLRTAAARTESLDRHRCCRCCRCGRGGRGW